VPCAGRNPDGALRGDDPGAFAGADGHYPTAGVDELIFLVKMLRDYVPVDEVEREGGDLRGQPGAIVSACGLSRIRHLLS